MSHYTKIAVCFFLLFVITSHSIYSQTNPFTMELRGGVNASKIDVDDWKVKAGYRAEALFQYYNPSGLYLQSGLGYNHRDTKADLKKENTIQSSLTMDYVHLPLMGGASVSFSKKIIYNMAIGAYAAYGVGGKYKTRTTVAETNQILVNYEKSAFSDKLLKPLDFGLRAEVGIEYSNLILSIGLEQGLIDIRKNKEILTDKIKNQNIYMTLGYRIF